MIHCQDMTGSNSKAPDKQTEKLRHGEQSGAMPSLSVETKYENVWHSSNAHLGR